MIGGLRGVLVDRLGGGEVLLDVAGVVYRVLVPVPAMAALGELGTTVYLHTHLHVREDAMVLYGFATRDERDTFEALLGAHGVGPALALAILSALRPVELQRAVIEGDAAALTSVPGVGAKTAARLLLELENRLSVPDLDLAAPAAAGPVRATVREALSGLGYGAEEIRAALADLPDADEQSLLRAALQRLAMSRSR